MINAALQLVDISKLGLNSKIKKFSYSFICGKGYSPPSGGRIAFCLQSATHKIRTSFLYLSLYHADKRLSNRFLFSGQRAFQDRRLAVNSLFHAVFLLFLF